MWIATAAEMLAIDQRAEREFGIAGGVLMENAASAALRFLLESWPDARRVCVFAGPGNNGGDGYALARLAQAAGLQATCVRCAPLEKLGSLCRRQADAAASAGVTIWPLGAEAVTQAGGADVLVDALLGVGAIGRPRDDIATAIGAMNSSGKPILALDVPTGVESDTGAAHEPSVRATSTVLFGLAKPYLFQGDGPRKAGRWRVVPIGLPEQMLNTPTGAAASTRSDVLSRLPQRAYEAHKGSSGRLLALAGSEGMPGAAVLAVRGALRAGAGLVTLASHPSALEALSAQLPEALLLDITKGDGLRALRAMHFDAGVFGPGLSTTPETMDTLRELWKDWQIPSCIDADALGALSHSLPTAPCVITPHPGEMGRLLQISTQNVQANRFASARLAAEQYSCVALLKGAYTVIAEAGRPLIVNPTGNPGMAAGGMGDVLSGIIGAFLAQGLSAFDAAMAGAYLHGAAADLCAEQKGSVGYLASEVADRLPEARAKLSTSCA